MKHPCGPTHHSTGLSEKPRRPVNSNVLHQEKQRMCTKEIFDCEYMNRATTPQSVQAIPRRQYMVYILTFNDNPIVLGHGKYNRARVIFDDKQQITSGHIKALFVRAYRLFGQGKFQQFIIECVSKDEAKKIEACLHRKIGGNSRDLSDVIKNELFKNIEDGTWANMVLRMALYSPFDGIADINLWRRKGILTDDTWKIISDKLQL
ncbi:MAG: hypothetical protein PHY54_14100 [Methylococcales bacterium]|nr:hypothetical protein [Methylococcales bacterium]